MNRLILLGNGFDLAHGLQTQYRDFMLDYINKAFTQSWHYHSYNDDLIDIVQKATILDLPAGAFKMIQDYLDYFCREGYFPLLSNTFVDYEGRRYNPFSKLKSKCLFCPRRVLCERPAGTEKFF